MLKISGLVTAAAVVVGVIGAWTLSYLSTTKAAGPGSSSVSIYEMHLKSNRALPVREIPPP